LGSGFVFSLGFEGGYIKGLGQEVRLTDRFFLGEPQIRGFDIRGVGPRVIRTFQDSSGAPDLDNTQDDAIGGNAYYLGRAELELPLGSGARELGLRPSIFVDVGAVFDVKRPVTTPGTALSQCQDNAPPNTIRTVEGTTCPANTTFVGGIPAFTEDFKGDTWKPRLSVGIGVNWNSPFGPFRIDVAKALLKEPGDQTKLFTFNVGTQF
jgi:outer membrane protein insertion porin family